MQWYNALCMLRISALGTQAQHYHEGNFVPRASPHVRISHAEYIWKMASVIYFISFYVGRDNLRFSYGWSSLVLLPRALADPIDLP